jgi:hypothetical protein
MPRGRPVTPLSKKDVRIIVKSEIKKALSQLNVKAILIGTKRKGRPFGSKAKKKGARKTQ